MTAEIAIYNKNCVALAADSAVTISSGNDTGKQKIYNGAEKLFALSKHHPVGVMVFGSGNLSSAPWEVAIKAYRKHLGSSSFNTLKEYADDFFSFLEKNLQIITQGMREQSCFQFLSSSIFNGLLESFASNQQADYWVDFDLSQYYLDLEQYCVDLLLALSDIEFLDNFDHDDIDRARDFCNQYTRVICENMLSKGDDSVPDSLINTVNEVFSIMLCKKNDLGISSGLVIAGFGDNDYYPTVLSYNVLGFFKDKLRKYLEPDKCSHNGACGVTPFAQDDEVNSFMQGVSPMLFQHLKGAYSTAFIDFLGTLDSIIDSSIENNDVVKSKIAEAAMPLFDNIDENINIFMRENYINKVIDMVEFLPKQDIAYMAESLVNLTAFKRKISDDSETVGGPIDVAVISKSDGFIWVKRKHYFDKDLNHHFFARS